MRILLITYCFPPFNSIGAIRPGKLASYLVSRGHDVRVLTCSNQPFPLGLPVEVEPDRVTAVAGWSINAPAEWLAGGRDRVAREGFARLTATSKRMGRLARWYRTLLHWPDAQVGWVRSARRAGHALMRGQRFDLIYVSAAPLSALRVGARLSDEFGVPWVAELRDLWTDNHAYAYPAWRRAIERTWESHLLGSAAAIVTVSAPLAAKLSHHGRPVWEIRNGYDPQDTAGWSAPEATPADELRVVFTGSIYPGHQDTETFCAGIARFFAQGGRIRVAAVGRDLAALAASAVRHNVSHLFEILPTVPRLEALRLQRSADLLLIFLWQGSEEGIYTTKFFEYAGAGRPMLAIGSRTGDVARWIEQSVLGSVASTDLEVEEALELWQARKASAGSLSVPSVAREDFSRQTQFARLEPLLQSLLPSQRHV
jgi:hypothetical protein